MGSRRRRADPGTKQHGDLRRFFRLEVGSLGAFKSLLVRQLTCGEANAVIGGPRLPLFQEFQTKLTVNFARYCT